MLDENGGVVMLEVVFESGMMAGPGPKLESVLVTI